MKQVLLCAQNEDCILACLRLADVLITILFEGGKTLGRLEYTQDNTNTNKRLEHAANTGDLSSHEQKHRKLSALIRSKDTDAFIKAREESNIDVNRMDSDGQTLLNWAAGLGTIEMVECMSKAERQQQPYTEMQEIYLNFFLLLLRQTFEKHLSSNIQKLCLGRLKSENKKQKQKKNNTKFE